MCETDKHGKQHVNATLWRNECYPQGTILTVRRLFSSLHCRCLRRHYYRQLHRHRFCHQHRHCRRHSRPSYQDSALWRRSLQLPNLYGASARRHFYGVLYGAWERIVWCVFRFYEVVSSFSGSGPGLITSHVMGQRLRARGKPRQRWDTGQLSLLRMYEEMGEPKISHGVGSNRDRKEQCCG